MPSPEPHFLEVAGAHGRRTIATLSEPGVPGRGPGLVWLQGFKSDMASTKASALAQWCAPRGLAFTRFDYSGHGRSGGDFEQATLSAWLEESRAVFEQLTRGPQVLVGSSMGGHLALLLVRLLARTAPEEVRRIRGLLLIAPAWDMTELLMWQRFAPEVQAAIVRDGRWARPSAYGDGPYVITRRLIEDGRLHLLGGSQLDPGCPVRILHGMRDPDVPWQHSLGLMEILGNEDVRLTLVKDGEHRLSRPQDLALLYQTVAELTDVPKG